MKIRRAELKDTDQIRQLFYDTVTNINIKDYDTAQISVWASGYNDIKKWSSKIQEQYFFVAEQDNKITGFGSITSEGYLDYMYVHKDHQGKGIASGLLKYLVQIAFDHDLREIRAEVSITARPFFRSKGFEITKTFITRLGEVEFEDCEMTKFLCKK